MTPQAEQLLPAAITVRKVEPQARGWCRFYLQTFVGNIARTIFSEADFKREQSSARSLLPEHLREAALALQNLAGVERVSLTAGAGPVFFSVKALDLAESPELFSRITAILGGLPEPTESAQARPAASDLFMAPQGS